MFVLAHSSAALFAVPLAARIAGALILLGSYFFPSDAYHASLTEWSRCYAMEIGLLTLRRGRPVMGDAQGISAGCSCAVFAGPSCTLEAGWMAKHAFRGWHLLHCKPPRVQRV